jgi:hypothetical protein
MTSQLNVDTIVDKAGSGGSNVKMANTSTYVSDGGSATQNTVQGLAKQWAKFTVAAALSDSLNTSSITDTATGNFEVNFSNAMSNANYAVTTCTFTVYGRETHCDASSTTAYGLGTWYNLSRSEDSVTDCGTAALGDLA